MKLRHRAVPILKSILMFLSVMGLAAAQTGLTSLPAAAQGETVVHDFPDPNTLNDGSNPVGSPVSDPASNMVYTASKNGGSHGMGALICINPNNKLAKVIHSFSGKDGAYPTGALFLVPGKGNTPATLYGTTLKGGVNADGVLINRGTVFKVMGNGGGFLTLHSFFGGSNDGEFPYAGVIRASDGRLYGTTLQGGSANLGVVYSLPAVQKSATTILHTFTGFVPGAVADGSTPYAKLVEYQEGMLAGTTATGGSVEGDGSVFVMSFNGDIYRMIHAFSGENSDGIFPVAELIFVPNSDGAPFLYGTTTAGGKNEKGIAYRLDPTGRTYQMIYTFGKLADGENPWGGLFFDAKNGNLYGTTRSGGLFGGGTIYMLSPASTAKEVVIHSFNPVGTGDGAAPLSSLIYYSVDGMLYGTCYDQGANFGGVLFNMSP